MYLVIRHDKSEHLKEKVHKMKEIACEIMECIEDAYEETRGRERERERDYGREYRRYEDRTEDMREGRENYGREEARGRGRY